MLLVRRRRGLLELPALEMLPVLPVRSISCRYAILSSDWPFSFCWGCAHAEEQALNAVRTDTGRREGNVHEERQAPIKRTHRHRRRRRRRAFLEKFNLSGPRSKVQCKNPFTAFPTINRYNYR